MNDIFGLHNKVALVTGASSGLGRQFAKSLAEQGANVVVLARRVDKLQLLVRELQQYGGKYLAVECNVADEAQVENSVKLVINHFDGIDILVNNAGVAGGGATENLSLEEWNRIISVDLTGVFLCSKHVGNVMKDKKYGKIINTASIAGFLGFDNISTAAYSAAKGGVVNFTRSLAAEWGKYGITVNAIAPGFFPSEMTEAFINDPQMMAYVKTRTALDRWGKDGELNGAMLYFASDLSSYTTGQILAVDGGWLAE